MKELRLNNFALQLSNDKIVAFETEVPYDDSFCNFDALFKLSDSEAQQLLEFLQENINT